MPFTFRVRHAGGQATLDGVPDGATVAELRSFIAEKTGIAERRQLLKVGFPPAALASDVEDRPLIDAGIRNREMLVVEEREPPPEPAGASEVAPAAAQPEVAQTDEPAEPMEVEPAAPSSEAQVAQAAARLDLPPAAPDQTVGEIERHVIEADNSCLFNSVGYLLRSQRAGAAQMSPQEMRAAVARQIAANPEHWDTYTLAESGRPSLEYAEWIQRRDSWGGSLELIVLSQLFGVQLSAVCIRSLRVDHYPHEGPHRHRAFVFYDGIHYDAVVASGVQDGSEIRLFRPDDDFTLSRVLALALEMKDQKQFTDTANFSLQCQHCWKLLKGEADAQKHGQETGHFNFQEVH